MIISSSRRNDSPAFYPIETIQKIISMNSGEQQKLLKKNCVDAVVFWTKNAQPIIPYLCELDNLEIPYYFQYTVNFYPHLEPNIPHITERIKTFKTLSKKIGKDRVIWRYDPFLTSTSPVIFTIPGVLERFEFVGNSLYEYTDKLVFSFLDPYPKLPPGLYPPTKEEELQIVDKILKLNKTWKLQLATCAEDMNNPFIEHNRCIDPVLLKKLGVEISDISKKDKTQRTSCGCYPSVDIGEYHTCRHGCHYCYAR